MPIIILFIFITLSLSGCFYPNEQKIQNQIPYPDQIMMVQNSVNQFLEDTGVLPIETKEANTPIYEKYVIDFKKLIPKYMSRLPGNSFEDGGTYVYVLVNVEEDPQVRLIDLRLTQEVRDLQLRLNEYLRRNTYLPVDQVIEGGYFTLDYNKLNLKKTPLVLSPFSNEYLPFIVNQEGRVGIDYSLDLYQSLQHYNSVTSEEEDIRYILVDDSYFVPAHSFPYIIKDGKPILKK